MGCIPAPALGLAPAHHPLSGQWVLATLLLKLEIGPRCTLDGRFLIVEGSLRSYKIHLGSSNVRMLPDDEYLCIVPDRATSLRQRTPYLPFEGDGMLAVILSKALLLAHDERIRDQSISRQIRRRKL